MTLRTLYMVHVQTGWIISDDVFLFELMFEKKTQYIFKDISLNIYNIY